jgi:hypothetical protein
VGIHAEDVDARLGISLCSFIYSSMIGDWSEVQRIWEDIGKLRRKSSVAGCRPGDIDARYVQSHLWRRDLTEPDVTEALSAATVANNRSAVRMLHSFYGEWLIEQGRWEESLSRLRESIRMAREIGRVPEFEDALMALANSKLRKCSDVGGEATRLSSQIVDPRTAMISAELWLMAGDETLAARDAFVAYRWASADGEPHVRRYYLDKTSTFLKGIGQAVPKVEQYVFDGRIAEQWELQAIDGVTRAKAQQEEERQREERLRELFRQELLRQNKRLGLWKGPRSRTKDDGKEHL